MFDYLVIGKGMMGAAAARYLSSWSDNVALVGPSEPTHWETHQGVFSSHYDSGRITRVLDKDVTWGRLAQRSIASYREIERVSGIEFYFQSGGVTVGRSEYIAKNEAVGAELGAAFNRFSSDQLPTELCLQFKSGLQAIYEQGEAGYIDPRRLVAAQARIAQQQGARLIEAEVLAVEPRVAHVDVWLQGGEVIQAKKVIVAAGAYASSILPRPIKLTRQLRTTVLARLSSAEVARLAKMPTVIFYDSQNQSGLESYYSVPPTIYPDGQYYLKIGGSMDKPQIAESAGDLTTWFNNGGSQHEADLLEAALRAIVPAIDIAEVIKKPCVVTSTAHNYPYIDVLEEDKLFILTGGTGAAAKSSDEIGRLGALIASGQWDERYQRDAFRVAY